MRNIPVTATSKNLEYNNEVLVSEPLLLVLLLHQDQREQVQKEGIKGKIKMVYSFSFTNVKKKDGTRFKFP